jgi:beta-lactamase regulating signal transducer with metallopeptidase domain/ankyrin repeat protein
MTEFSNTAGFAITHLWQSVLIAAALAGILILGRRMSGATRYAVAGVALMAAALAPLAAFLPESGIITAATDGFRKLVGADAPVAPEGAATAKVKPDGTIQIAARLPAPARAYSRAEPNAAPDTPYVPTTARPAANPLTGSAAPAMPLDRSAEAAASKPWFTFPKVELPKLPDLTLPFLAVWALGTIVMLARLGLDLAAAEKLAKRAKPVQLPAPLQRRMGAVRVAVSADAPGPMAAGLLKAQVILPESALAMLDQPEMAALMEHERAHIERLDVWAALAQRVALAMFWWSPAMHWVSRRIDEEREVACDECAVARTGDARTFARTLTTHAQSHAWARAPRMAVGAIGPRSKLGRRIRHLIDMAKKGKVPANYSGRLSFVALSLALVAAVIVTPRIVAQTPGPQARPSPSPSASPRTSPSTLAGGADSRTRVIIQRGDLTPEQESRLREALRDIDAEVVVRHGRHVRLEDLGPEIEARVAEAMAGVDASEAGAAAAEAGLAASQEVLARLPEILAHVQAGIGNADFDFDLDDVHDIQDLTPEQRAEVERAIAQARVEIDRAREQVRIQLRDHPPMSEAERARIRVEVQASVRAAQQGQQQAVVAMAQAEEARRAGVEEAIASIQRELDTRGSTMSAQERSGLQRALDGLKRSRDSGQRAQVRIANRDRGDRDDRSANGSPERRLYSAAEDCDNGAVRELIAAHADVNRAFPGDGTALIAAAREGCLSTVSLLLSNGADPNRGVRGDGTPLTAAAAEGQLSIVNELIAKGADVNAGLSGDGNPLIVAARNGEMSIVRSLLQHGANVNGYVIGDESPLIAAIEACEDGIARLLVERGANVNLSFRVRGEIRSPLSTAVKVDCEEMQDYLRSKGAQVSPAPVN